MENHPANQRGRAMAGYTNFEHVRRVSVTLERYPEFRTLPLAQRHVLLGLAARGEMPITAASIKSAIENLAD
jgi:hypothetical protein